MTAPQDIVIFLVFDIDLIIAFSELTYNKLRQRLYGFIYNCLEIRVNDYPADVRLQMDEIRDDALSLTYPPSSRIIGILQQV